MNLLWQRMERIQRRLHGDERCRHRAGCFGVAIPLSGSPYASRPQKPADQPQRCASGAGGCSGGWWTVRPVRRAERCARAGRRGDHSMSAGIRGTKGCLREPRGPHPSRPLRRRPVSPHGVRAIGSSRSDVGRPAIVGAGAQGNGADVQERCPVGGALLQVTGKAAGPSKENPSDGPAGFDRAFLPPQ